MDALLHYSTILPKFGLMNPVVPSRSLISYQPFSEMETSGKTESGAAVPMRSLSELGLFRTLTEPSFCVRMERSPEKLTSAFAVSVSAEGFSGSFPALSLWVPPQRFRPFRCPRQGERLTGKGRDRSDRRILHNN